jgi:transcriptional regulator with XRE-family HTH domain
MTALELLGATIRSHRKRLHLTQKQLAAKADMDYTNISDIERGKGNPSVRSLLRLAMALQIPPSHLLQPLDNRSDLILSE